ncbi:MAG: HEAT repeat domain-containing protein, partial [Myxococcota bacterium]|nr:HEAT repeat domain-containing protein [Myxococcota bacterium]
TMAAVARVLERDESWAVRVLAARAVGRLGAAGAGAEASPELVAVATRDPYALVREAALESLASFDAAAAKVLAMRMAGTEPEPRVRDTARAVAAGERPAGE